MVLGSRNSNNFDFLRFIAAIFVVVTHSFAFLGLNENEDFAGKLTNFPFSYYGVRIFFMISGYLILSSALNSKTALSYLKKRVLRIFPGLFVMLTVLIFIVGLIFSKFPLAKYFSEKPYQIYWTFSLFRGWGTLPGVCDKNPLPYELLGSIWTLKYEFFFYLIVILLKKLNFFRYKILTFFLCIILVLLNLFLNSSIQSIIIPKLYLKIYYLIDFGIFFAIGMSYFLVRHLNIFNYKFLLGSLVIMVVLFRFDNTLLFQYLILPYIIFYLSNLKGKLNDFGRYGDFSYGIYIYNFPVQQILVQEIKFPLQPYQLTILSLLITIPISIVSWNFIEKPALSLK